MRLTAAPAPPQSAPTRSSETGAACRLRFTNAIIVHRTAQHAKVPTCQRTCDHLTECRAAAATATRRIQHS